MTAYFRHPEPNHKQPDSPLPSLEAFMERARLPEDVARRILEIASNIDQADALAELVR
ncbi:MAG TPA: hypothetical protein VGM83_03350 [Devosiaceae bacterium]|jgi:hypothetical protein